ncbi:hypothetical protein FPZ44_25135 [Paenibacillus agilis]|uniref:Uncharacterized protein n=1 Tax=Paenibacillus agilis TaxID=3020863 RepID=A0A559IDA8_9BACL|nr:hypothetical protein FPZ44_25135 [Paenibacillus agilis]
MCPDLLARRGGYFAGGGTTGTITINGNKLPSLFIVVLGGIERPIFSCKAFFHFAPMYLIRTYNPTVIWHVVQKGKGSTCSCIFSVRI